MQQALIASALVIQHLLLTNDLEIMNNLQNQLTGLMKTLQDYKPYCESHMVCYRMVTATVTVTHRSVVMMCTVLIDESQFNAYFT